MSTFYESPNDYRNYLCHYGVPNMKRPHGLKYKKRGGSLRAHRLEQARKVGLRDSREEDERRQFQSERDQAESDDRQARRERDNAIGQSSPEHERQRRHEEKIREEEIRRRDQEHRERAADHAFANNSSIRSQTSKRPHSRSNPGDLNHLYRTKKRQSRKH